MSSTAPSFDVAVVDLDGTLIDSSYHHVLAWSQAFVQVGMSVELWRIHQHMGMGGDRLVKAVTNSAVEASLGDTLRKLWRHNYDLLLHYVRPLAGAVDLLDALSARGLKVAIASSGEPLHTRRGLRILSSRRDFAVVDADDAAQSKPASDLVRAAIDKVDGTRAVMIGDTVWDVEAAAGCGVPTIAVGTGGIELSTLEDAAAAVFETPRDLADHLDDALSVAAQHIPTPSTGTQDTNDNDVVQEATAGSEMRSYR